MSKFWADEIHEEGYRIGLQASRVLFSKHSDFQKVEIIETTHYCLLYTSPSPRDS